MKKMTFYLFVFASVLLVNCNNQAPKSAHTDDEMIAAAKAVDAKFVESVNKEDLDGVMSCYWNSPDLVLFPPDAMEIKGYDAVKESFARFFKDMPGAQHEMLGSEYRVAGDMVYCWGRVKLNIPANPADSLSSPQTMEGRYSSVFAYKDSAMVYIFDHASMPLPPPPAPTPAEAKK